ncbi:MAG: YjfB family protein [Rhizobacter sp.]|nr:YjfB family protein [Rhizobacter sp.]
MAVNLASGAIAALNNPATSDAVSIAMLKKSLTAQETSAAQLLQALPAPLPRNPPHLGNNVDTFA